MRPGENHLLDDEERRVGEPEEPTVLLDVEPRVVVEVRDGRHHRHHPQHDADQSEDLKSLIDERSGGSEENKPSE